MTPVVGLSTYREVSRHGVWTELSDLLPSEYGDAVRLAGGVPVLLPVPAPGWPDVAAAAAAVCERLDGLVVSGGGDVSPAAYGAEPHPRTGGVLEARDAWELALLDAAAARDMPVLGICRGMQVMAVHAGGSLHQHVPDVVGHEEHNPGGDSYGTTEVEVAAGTRLASLIGPTAKASCHHHQAVAEHPGFEAVAHATSDGSLEAMEAPGPRFCLAVQWHPETSDEVGLFTGFVRAARDSGTAVGGRGAWREGAQAQALGARGPSATARCERVRGTASTVGGRPCGGIPEAVEQPLLGAGQLQRQRERGQSARWAYRLSSRRTCAASGAAGQSSTR
ncbi:gamma-glutamyl-gamma-aminobutyrate hydrolase family protein [Nocardioides sp. TF02-7]|uniref:gamma-glutamyl-gamma-aminobutyrate hydrolase family protein n=1 Tax=Nocardioides sp. TF02-7 TaxID=2917724 RepID=UPI001F05A333|nr:gamma-glutamyl-gamma-aminobutyrate hydrolase family protein [Nocardioides sp. TF02-7]UMG92462.1 gamma-glutamyl-gamma-aminobutyrate hydrolase family protein [Nocardioides sp. TF02-7]